MRIALVLAALIALPATAQAADCSAVPPGVAAKAASRLKKGLRVAPYCKSCGHSLPTRKNVYTVVSAVVAQPEGVSATATPNKAVWVTLKGIPQPQEVDLSRLYVELAARSGKFQNLGQLAGCRSREPALIKLAK